MSEELVAVEPDTGLKKRWGVGRFLYRQDGKKLTVNKQFVLAAVVGAFLLSTALLLLKGPDQPSQTTPIGFTGVVSQSQMIELPRADAPGSIGNVKRKHKGVTVVHYGGLEIIPRRTSIKIPPGTFVNAQLSTGASNGLVKATLSEDLNVDGETLVQSGTVLVGVGNSTDDRLLVEFSKMVFKDGSVQTVHAQACDAEDQIVGLKGSKINRYGTALAAGIGLNFAAGMADALQQNTYAYGMPVRANTIGNAALNGAATASLEQGKAIMEKWKNEKTVIEVKKGTNICVLFSGD